MTTLTNALIAALAIVGVVVITNKLIRLTRLFLAPGRWRQWEIAL